MISNIFHFSPNLCFDIFLILFCIISNIFHFSPNPCFNIFLSLPPENEKWRRGRLSLALMDFWDSSINQIPFLPKFSQIQLIFDFQTLRDWDKKICSSAKQISLQYEFCSKVRGRALFELYLNFHRIFPPTVNQSGLFEDAPFPVVFGYFDNKEI